MGSEAEESLLVKLGTVLTDEEWEALKVHLATKFQQELDARGYAIYSRAEMDEADEYTRSLERRLRRRR